MASLVKKVGNKKYYQIDTYRAAGIIFYFIKNKNIYILINKENRNNKVVYNSIGGKVDKYDKTIFETMTREFNEETGFLVSDKLNKIKFERNKCIELIKSKYLLLLYEIKFDNIWDLLPYTYSKIFENVEPFNHRESLSLEWVNLFEFKEKNTNFLLKMLLSKVKNNKRIRKFNSNYQIPFL
tara:strand:- start:1438 stop:1983 length:546 start_codon:yes stop_codon:yes gene_type:complete